MFIFLIMFVIGTLLMRKGPQLVKSTIESMDTNHGLWKKVEEKVKGRHVYNQNIYKVYKGGHKLSYIVKTPTLRHLLEDLSFLMTYHIDVYLDIVIYVEQFLRIHFNVLIGKYDISTHYDIIRDIRQQILYLMSTCVFNLPNTSTIYDIQPNVDEFMVSKTRDMNAILSKYVTVLKHKLKVYHSEDVDAWDGTSSVNVMHIGV